MIVVEYEHNLEIKIVALEKLPAQIKSAQRSALSSVGFMLSRAIIAHIENDGSGSWPESDPLTRAYRGKYGAGVLRERVRSYKGAFNFLSQFVRYRIYGNRVLVLGFAKEFTGRSFDAGLQKIAARVQSGHKTVVTPKMRKNLAADTRERGDRQPGKDYFPLRKTTSQLVVPPRPIEKPVVEKTKASVFPLFVNKFQVAMQKRFDKL